MANTIGKGKRMSGKMPRPQGLPRASRHSRREDLQIRKIQAKRAKDTIKSSGDNQ